MSSMSTAATAVPRTAWQSAASAPCDSKPDQDKERDGSKDKEKAGSEDRERDDSEDAEKDDSEDKEKGDSKERRHAAYAAWARGGSHLRDKGSLIARLQVGASGYYLRTIPRCSESQVVWTACKRMLWSRKRCSP
eukprot:TRINITY_DN7216_c0_g2_i1.p2 TRINITY_DN7216_c0_g2~~TRINITY_DN7216_c0_g2_i1.p2  ORF type:complete len:135 (-),score=30.64 TRINITY_DN7216_c0_g2_i1:108-512(-)